MNCPPSDTLERLALGFLDDEAPLRAHLTSCAACAKRMEVLAGDHAALTVAAKRVSVPKVASPAMRPWKLVAIAAVLLIAVLALVSVPSLQRAPDAVMAAQESRMQRGSTAADPNYRRPKGIAELEEAGEVTLPPPVKLDPTKPLPSVEPPAGNVFVGTVANPTIDPTKDPLSTFALDVDTASYTIARRYLMDGRLPPAEAVRVEEFVNYFRYADPKPPKGAFQVLLEAAPSPFDPALHLLRIAVQAKEIAEKDRKDCVLTFVIDVSGSMAMENRLGLVKRSLRALVERLRPTDKVGIVVYGTTGRKLLDPTPAARRAQILGIIDELVTEGSTNLEAGLNIGYALAAEHLAPKGTNRVVVCTDGVANNGVTDAETLLKNVAEKSSQGVWLSVLGFGMGNMNDALMEKLADKGNGNYAYIDDFKEAKKIFTEKLVGMLEVVAADAKVQVEFDPRTVASFRQLGYENRRLAHEDFRNDKVDAGEVGANHHVTALYEVRLKPGAEGRLATVRLRYREPDTKEVVESQESLGRGQVFGTVDAASPSYRLAATVAQFAELLRDGPRAKAVTVERLLEEASRAAADLGRPEDAVEFLDLLKRAAALKR